MPELPEVEIVKQSLSKRIKHKRVKKIIIKNRNLRFKLDHNFSNIVKNSVVENISRFSKYLIIKLDNSYYWLIHLGMSGTLHVVDKNKQKFLTNLSFYQSPNLPEKHNHIHISFDKFKIIYNDPRRFGYFLLLKSKYKLDEFISNYGPEPFNKKFNQTYLKKKLSNKSKNIKNYLLDQKFVSGIGNIYASEILFLAKINPERKSAKLKLSDYKKIIFFSKKVLKKAIKKGGSSIQNFKNSNGKTGSFQKYFQVYDREGMHCLSKKCDGIIKKKVISNRSSFYCNICQKI